MFARHSFAAALAIAAAGAQASSVIVATDKFDGSATGWTSAWTSTSVGAISDGTLKFTGTTGSSDDLNIAASRQLAAPINANKVLISFDVSFSAGIIDQNDFLALWLGNSSGPNVGIKGDCDGGAGCNGADLFVRPAGTLASSTQMVVGETYHLFAVLEKLNGGPNYNRFSLWVDPTDLEISSLSGADAIANGASNISSFSTVGFRTANLDAGDVITVDNLNVSVVPEPGSFALAGLALLGLAATRRRAK